YHKFICLSNDASPYGDMMHLLRKYDVAPLRFAMMRCLPPIVAKPRIIREASIIRRSRHHLPKANIIQKRNFCLVDKSSFFVGGDNRALNLALARHLAKKPSLDDASAANRKRFARFNP
ncbi:MAG: hypothetical protein IJW97_00910, partial [Clostridia bacterium]|nr:hypothetical protein [Clostridia bacterium]